MAKTVSNIPTHIAFIMDGNGRWAKKRLLPRKLGHREGVKALKRMIEACRVKGILQVSVYAFSTENWGRPQDEVDALFDMIRKFASDELTAYAKQGYRIRFMGDINGMPEDLRDTIVGIMKTTAKNDIMTVNIALNYGGQDELVRAVNKLIACGKEINISSINSALDTAGMAMPDIIVRSAGERRLSNFMLWQAAYSELIFVDDYWPDVDTATLDAILIEYNNRERRFGKVTNA